MVTLQRIRQGVCGYNQEGEVTCLCDDFPLTDTEDWNEPEYRLALERKGHVEIFGFLCEWDMTRPHSWHYGLTKPSQLASRILPVRKVLSQLRGVDLAAFTELEHGAYVATAFNVLRRPEAKREGVGLTSPSKILHILMPELFVPWDEDIRGLYGVDEDSEGEGYTDFIQTCSEELQTVAQQEGISPKGLAALFYSGDWKPATKILDEFHMATVKRYPPHFSPAHESR